MRKSAVIALLNLGAILGAGTGTGQSASWAATRVTEPLLSQHGILRSKLGHIDELNRGMLASRPEDQKAVMESIASRLEEDVTSHATSEEQAVYSAVDRKVQGKRHPFTETMRYESRIIQRWADDLGRQVGESDPLEFNRRVNRLLGLLTAHIDEEEDVLFPILDRSMTPQQFRKEVLAKIPSKGGVT